MRGRPLTLGNLDEKVQKYIRALRKAGTPVNARVVLAAAEGIVKATDRTLLFENGGHIKLSLDWAYSFLRRMGYVKRKATTKARTSLTQEYKKKGYLRQAVRDGKVPPELVINWDQTGVNVVPSSQWTQAEKGTSRVEIAGAGDKRQTHSVATCCHFKFYTKARCHPLTHIPEGFDIKFWHSKSLGQASAL